MQTGPTARHRAHRLQTVQLFACNRQTKLHARQTQPRGRFLEASVRIEATINARKCTQIAATDGQHVHRYLAGCLRERAVFGHLRIAQGHGFGGFRQAELALCGHESINVQRHIAAGLQQLALDTVQIQTNGRERIGAGLHTQIGFAQRVIHHHGLCRFGCDHHSFALALQAQLWTD